MIDKLKYNKICISCENFHLEEHDLPCFLCTATEEFLTLWKVARCCFTCKYRKSLNNPKEGISMPCDDLKCSSYNNFKLWECNLKYRQFNND